MTRLELLQLVLGRARNNGFELRRWYTSRLELPWISADAATSLLATQRRYYALVFSQEFARAFWKEGTEITFDVPPQSFSRTMPDGTTRIVERRAYIRRSARPNAWRYHLRQMALAEEPLRYLRKYLRVEADEIDEVEVTKAPPADGPKSHRLSPAIGPSSQALRGKRPTPRPLPTDLPAFLRRSYQPGPKKV